MFKVLKNVYSSVFGNLKLFQIFWLLFLFYFLLFIDLSFFIQFKISFLPSPLIALASVIVMFCFISFCNLFICNIRSASFLICL